MNFKATDSSSGALFLTLMLSFPLIGMCGVPSRSLFQAEFPIQIAFYDFDKTFTTYSFGEQVLNWCIDAGLDCEVPGNMVSTLLGLGNLTEVVMDAVGGEERIERVKTNFERVENIGIKMFVLSTSWEPVPAHEWAELIHETQKVVGVDHWFPFENILSLDDPGPGIPADKGAVLEAKLLELGIDKDFCLFSDDSTGNIESATGKCDTLHIIKREGLDYTDLEFIEMRSYIGDPTTCHSGDRATDCTPNDGIIAIGSRIGNRLNLSTWQECCAECDTLLQYCAAWSYHKNSSGCILMARYTSERPQDGWMSYKKPPNSGFDAAPEISRGGQDVSDSSGRDVVIVK